VRTSLVLRSEVATSLLRRVALGLLMVIAFAVLAGGCGGRIPSKLEEGPVIAPPPVAEVSHPKLTHGPDSAKVHIEAFYPLNEKHLKIVEFLNSLADRYPGKVKVTAWDFRTEEGGKRTQQAFGKICGGIQVNGKSEFTVVIAGKPRPVSLQGGEWVAWTRPEVEAVVEKVVKETYPGSMPAAAGK